MLMHKPLDVSHLALSGVGGGEEGVKPFFAH